MFISFTRQNLDPILWTTFVNDINIDELSTNIKTLEVSNRPKNLGRTYLLPSGISAELIEYITSYNFKEILISKLKEDKLFLSSWGSNFTNNISKYTNITAEICAEDIGSGNNLHLDYRTDVASGMIFFDEYDDKLKSTYFYKDSGKTLVHRSNTSQGCGWFLPNMHNSWHTGGNKSLDIRYFIIYNLRLILM